MDLFGVNETRENRTSPNIKKFIKQNEILKNYSELIFSNKKGQFLDLSCGTRDDIKQIVESFDWTWIGVDQIDKEGIIKADVHNLPFQNNQFDVVYSAATFEHYYNPWKVASEVERVLKNGGYFCGLIAFIQPWHGDSYYHFSHLGTKEMLNKIGFRIIDIRAGDINGLKYLIQTIFPSPFSIIGKSISFFADILIKIRKHLFPLFIKLMYFRNKDQKLKKLLFLKDDEIRYAASIVFCSQKQINSNSK